MQLYIVLDMIFFMNYDYERDWNHEKIMNQFVVKIASKDFQFWEVALR